MSADRILRIENHELGPSTTTFGRRPSEVSAMIELAANRLLARVNVSSDEIVEFTAQVERAVLRELALVN